MYRPNLAAVQGEESVIEIGVETLVTHCLFLSYELVLAYTMMAQLANLLILPLKAPLMYRPVFATMQGEEPVRAIGIETIWTHCLLLSHKVVLAYTMVERLAR